MDLNLTFTLEIRLGFLPLRRIQEVNSKVNSTDAKLSSDFKRGYIIEKQMFNRIKVHVIRLKLKIANYP